MSCKIDAVSSINNIIKCKPKRQDNFKVRNKNIRCHYLVSLGNKIQEHGGTWFVDKVPDKLSEPTD